MAYVPLKDFKYKFACNTAFKLNYVRLLINESIFHPEVCARKYVTKL